MKIRVVSKVLSVLIGVAFLGSAAQAESNFAASKSDSKKKTEASLETKVRAAVSAATPVKTDLSKDAKKKKIEEKKKELNGSRWDIALTASGPGGKTEDEELYFQDGKVSFKGFSEAGFGASNYTISMAEGSETGVWETMQTGSKNQVLFVRGEWKDEQMTGIVSHQNPDEPEKPAKDYTFTTKKRMAIAPVSAAKEKEAGVVAAPSSEEHSNVLSSEPEADAKKA
jgi:hypothetical protein